MPKRTSRLISRHGNVAVVGLAAAFGIAGCGDDPGEVLHRALRTPIERTYVSIALDLDPGGSEAGRGPVQLRVSGPYHRGEDEELPSVDWSVTASNGARQLSARIVSTGDNAFLNLGGTDYEVGENRVARLKRRLRGEGGGVARFGLEPRAWLTDAREKGEAEIAGVETTHLSAAAEVPRMLDDLSGLVELAAVTDLTRDHRRKVAKAVGSARFQSRPRFDVYVRKDGVLRRLATEVRFRQAGRGRSLGGAPRGGITLSIDFSRIGEAQEIAAPPTARPLSALARLRRPRGSHDFPRSARRGRSPSKPDARSPRRDAGGADGRKTPEKGRAKPLTQGQLERYNRCTLLRSRALALRLAIVEEPSLETRLELLLWHLADRWGRREADASVLLLPLTATALAELANAHPSAVGRALERLAERGRFARRPDGAFALLGDPPASVAGSSQDHAPRSAARSLTAPRAPLGIANRVPARLAQ